MTQGLIPDICLSRLAERFYESAKSINFLREKAGSEEHHYHMVEQYGLEPLYKKLKLSK